MGTGLLTPPIISVDSVVVGPPQERRLSIPQLQVGGGLHLIMGENGAGKTTLIRLLATVLDAPWQGEVTIGGERLRGWRSVRAIRRRLGYVPQQLAFPSHTRLADFLAYLGTLKDLPSSVLADEVDRVLGAVHLTEKRGARLRSLSGGMRRRATIAQALLGEPAFLLLDEPTAGLDRESLASLYALLAPLTEQRCVLMSTHLDADLALAPATITRLREGQVTFHGAPDADIMSTI